MADPEIDAYCLTHNETSTGVAMPLERPDGADGLVLVDATSAAGGLRFDPAEVDVYYFAPQKCLASDGGLWLAAVSPAAIERIERIAASDRWVPASLDLKIALDNSRKDQTYNTPALATVFLANQQVDWINQQGGLSWAASRCDQSAAAIYGWAEGSRYATPFVKDPAQRSHVVATIDLDEGVADANVVAAVLRDQRHPRHGELPQAGSQPAARRALPRHRSRRRHRPHRRASTTSSQHWPSGRAQARPWATAFSCCQRRAAAIANPIPALIGISSRTRIHGLPSEGVTSTGPSATRSSGVGPAVVGVVAPGDTTSGRGGLSNPEPKSEDGRPGSTKDPPPTSIGGPAGGMSAPDGGRPGRAGIDEQRRPVELHLERSRGRHALSQRLADRSHDQGERRPPRPPRRAQ